MFERTPQQDKQFKEGVCIKYKKQGYYIRDYRQGQRINTVKGISMLYSEEKLKGIREYIIKNFIFCYNDYCLTHQEAKYGISYQPQELKLDILKGTKKADLLQEIDQDLIATFNKVLAAMVLQEYIRVANNAEREALVIAYQGLENY